MQQANPYLPWIILAIVVVYTLREVYLKHKEKRAAIAAEKARARAEKEKQVAEHWAAEHAKADARELAAKTAREADAARQQALIDAIDTLRDRVSRLPQQQEQNDDRFAELLKTLLQEHQTALAEIAADIGAGLTALPAALEAKLGERLKEDYAIANGFLQGIQKCCESIVKAAEAIGGPVSQLAAAVQSPAPAAPSPLSMEPDVLSRREDQDLMLAKVAYIVQGKTPEQAELLAQADREKETAMAGIELNF